jgi:hypothetical protein
MTLVRPSTEARPFETSDAERMSRSSFASHARNPFFWVACLLYFVAATPFELDQSGFTFLLRLACVLGLAIPLVLSGRTNLVPHPMVIVALVVLLAANISALIDRSVLAISLIFATSILAQSRDQRWLEMLGHVLVVYLAVNATGLVLQTATLWGTGTLLDLHGSVFQSAARIEVIGTHGRLSGFHNEPGTFSQWMLMTLLLRCLLTRRLFSFFNMLICATIMSTISLWGVMGVTAYLIAVAIEALLSSSVSQMIKRLALLFSLGVTILIVVATQVPTEVIEQSLAFLEAKADVETNDSSLDKLLAAEHFSNQIWDLIVIGAPITPGFCPPCIAPNDAGLGLNSVYYFGLLLVVVLGSVIIFRVATLWGISYLPLFGMMMIWKAPFYDPAVWMIIGLVLAFKGHDTPSFPNAPDLSAAGRTDAR